MKRRWICSETSTAYSQVACFVSDERVFCQLLHALLVKQQQQQQCYQLHQIGYFLLVSFTDPAGFPGGLRRQALTCSSVCRCTWTRRVFGCWLCVSFDPEFR